MRRKLSRHAEWRGLLEVSGPFLSPTTLEKAFPQGLEAIETPRRQRLRGAYDEWREAIDEGDPQLLELHREWTKIVLEDLLEYDRDVFVGNEDFGDTYVCQAPDCHVTFMPDRLMMAKSDERPRLFVSILPPGTDLEKIQKNDGWPSPIVDRMIMLCRTTGVRLGLVTNGERWMLVNAPVGSPSSHTSWYARLWFQEPVTLKAFVSLLGIRRFFGPADDTLDALLDESLKHSEEVTDTLGEQVRRAVEVLVQCLDKADQDRNRELMEDVSPTELYEAGLTVMMRLVFLLCAEERGLLLLDEPIYDQNYAISTLRGQLAEEADRHGPEVLERRHDAWARLLAVFRAVYGGMEHESLRLPALGGSLFDPDRFPFLEGRIKGTGWRDIAAIPLPIDNRTVLLLLEALQLLEQQGGALLLSYKALDVENIGHVYEGLLEHTVARVPEVTLGLLGSQKARNLNISLRQLEEARSTDERTLTSLLLEVTQRSESALKNALAKVVDETLSGRVLTVCGGDTEVAQRILPFANLLRVDAWGEPIVYKANSFMVTLGADRRETGTHYTPKSLTETIVATTLEPVAYIGPAEGKLRVEWRLRSPAELLDLKICDPAMGSGAFLVQTCRWLSERLVEAWNDVEKEGRVVTIEGEIRDTIDDADPMLSNLDDRLTIARRLVAERCLYGVDINPMAVELAKLSIWLVTMAKGYPFGFLDHNLRSGDSLLGIHRLDQLTHLSMKPEEGRQQLHIFGQNIQSAVNEVIELRKRLRMIPIRDIRDVENMTRLDLEARMKLKAIEQIADAMIGEVLRLNGNASAISSALNLLAVYAADFLQGNKKSGEAIANQACKALSVDLPQGNTPRKPFQWLLEFPEVYFSKTGFDAFLFNPPFMGGTRISGRFGSSYLAYLKSFFHTRQNTDLCAYFFQRILSLGGNNTRAGFVATKTISQGDTREASLDILVNENGKIYRAVPDMPWPGRAAVRVSLIWIEKIKTSQLVVLGNKEVGYISSFLTEETDNLVPYSLSGPYKSFKGVTVVGNDLFTVSEAEYKLYIDSNKRNGSVIKPFLVGANLTSTPEVSPARLIIDFGDMSENEAASYKEPFRHVLERVRPFRMTVKRKAHRERWWQYGDVRQGLRSATESLQRVLVSGQTVKYLCFVWCPSIWVFDQKCVVIATDRDDVCAILSSSFFDSWARKYCATLGETLSFTPSDAFDTFPFPERVDVLSNLGAEFHEERRLIMLARQEGLTTIYNRLHNPKDTSKDINLLRALHAKMDQDVATSYSWGGIEFEHGFHQRKEGIRFTISEKARVEMLQRLLQLNHERHKEEALQGLRVQNRKKK